MFFYFGAELHFLSKEERELQEAIFKHTLAIAHSMMGDAQHG